MMSVLKIWIWLWAEKRIYAVHLEWRYKLCSCHFSFFSHQAGGCRNAAKSGRDSAQSTPRTSNSRYKFATSRKHSDIYCTLLMNRIWIEPNKFRGTSRLCGEIIDFTTEEVVASGLFHSFLHRYCGLSISWAVRFIIFGRNV